MWPATLANPPTPNTTRRADSRHSTKHNPLPRFAARPQTQSSTPIPAPSQNRPAAPTCRATPSTTRHVSSSHASPHGSPRNPPCDRRRCGDHPTPPRTMERQRREGARSRNDRPSFPPLSTSARKQADHLRIQCQPLPHPASPSRRAGIAKNRRSPTKQPRQTTPSPIRQRMQHANPHQPRLRIEHGFGAKCPRSPPKTKGQQSLQPQTAPTRSLGFLRPGKTKRR